MGKDKVEEMTESSTSSINDFRKIAPKAGPAPKVEVGSAESFTLPNGLKSICCRESQTS